MSDHKSMGKQFQHESTDLPRRDMPSVPDCFFHSSIGYCPRPNMENIMTRDRDENASDLALEEAGRAKIREKIGVGYVRRALIAFAIDNDLDQDQMSDALSESDIPGLIEMSEINDVDMEMLMDEAVALAQEYLDDSGRQIIETFGEPDILSGAGNRWYKVDDEDKAVLAQRLGGTAIGHVWLSSRHRVNIIALDKKDSHEWLIMLDDYHRAVVSMAAKKEGVESAYGDFLADCHVTGYNNKDAFFEYEEDIRMICAIQNLVCTPNHMGRPLTSVENDGPGM